MYERSEERSKRRIPCQVVVEGTRFSGIVLDLSSRGMFVQTNARPRPGLLIEVILKVPGWTHEVTLAAKVARNVVVPPRLIAIAHGGVGLRVLHPPPAYREFVERLGTGGEQMEDPALEDTISAPVTPSTASSGGRRTRGGGGGRARNGGGSAPGRPRRFRVHVRRVDGSGEDLYTMSAPSEEEAGARVLAELGDDWKLVEVGEA